MNPIQLMKINETNFTKQEIIIMDSIIENVEDLTNLSLMEFADKISISKSALLRFCQKIGYEGYSQFKYAISRYVSELPASDDNSSQQKNLTDMYSDTILTMDSFIGDKDLESLYSKLNNAHSIKVFGYAETGISAHYFSDKLQAYGYDAEAIIQLHNLRRKIQVAHQDDLLIFISISGNTSIMNELVTQAQDAGLKSVLVTQNSFSTFKEYVDQTILLPYFSESSFVLDPHVILYVFFSKLINYINENK
ncbi:MurR/RpiR family transcriptional regulator [Erysipelothrix inopinata]|uniref:MurR/RpiR family transcriptional regulator n=1 Tax=Erysipelothrix inopinata TaxID=225084 RepID=A0A7G9RYP8_9FIRM|nr:MurR/RpiR family transcriptional regulator [Erysipelothrix inopinata]QNN60723.1 MurR/RpiR family transcriptional regulator [Erysipelothrix inopinata]